MRKERAAVERPVSQRVAAAKPVCFSSCARGFLLAVQKQRRYARIAQLPDGAVENKMMNIDERGEREEARGKVGVKHAADDPRSGNEQRDAAGNQRHKIASERPVGLAGRAGFFFLVVAGDPQVLRGMQNREQAAAVSRLRNFAAADQLDYRWQ